MIEVLFDTETTGLIKPKANDVSAQPYITDLYMVKIERIGQKIEVLGAFETLLKVPVPLSPEITRITGLTDEDLADAPEFIEIYSTLAEFMTGVDSLVAHNLAFDRSMLANELVRCDKVIKFPWPRNHICTVEKTIHIEQRRLSLTRLHEHFFGVAFEGAHRARTDVNAMLKCYREMAKQGLI